MMNINEYTSGELIDILIDRGDLEDMLEHISDLDILCEVEHRGLQESGDDPDILDHPDIEPLLNDIYLDYTQNKDLRESVSKLLIKIGLLVGPLKNS